MAEAILDVAKRDFERARERMDTVVTYVTNRVAKNDRSTMLFANSSDSIIAIARQTLDLLMETTEEMQALRPFSDERRTGVNALFEMTVESIVRLQNEHLDQIGALYDSMYGADQ